MVKVASLWGDEFTLTEDYDKVKQILKRASSVKSNSTRSPEKILKAKNVTFEEKLQVTQAEVERILGHRKDSRICIYTKEDLHDYVSKCIENGVLAIDTETIGTRTDIPKPATDPYTCKLGGLCLYTPGQRSAYIPVNHVDYKTEERISSQVTEEDIKEELLRLNSAETFNIYHNGKFDFQVLYFTCGVKVPIWWDSMVAAQCLNENELAGLKFQYRDKIDPEQEKYDLDKLFDISELRKYPIELFSLYAATDAQMTYELYEWQKKEFKKAGNERLYNLFKDIEMPVVTVTAEMEMRGMSIDLEFAERLSKKFHIRLDKINKEIEKELSKYSKYIIEWRNTPEANYAPIVKGKRQKSLSEKLSDPVELSSPTQLGILLYDILGILKEGKDKKRSTDEAALVSIQEKFPLAKMILEKREYDKLLSTYIDALPTYCNPRDGRLHAKINQMGREDKNVVTGRMSSSSPNMQNIPARGDVVSIRCMFTSTVEYNEYDRDDDFYEVPIADEVLLSSGEYKWSSELVVGDILDTSEEVEKIEVYDEVVKIFVKA